MKEKTLGRANEIKRSIETLYDLRRIFSYPYPKIFKNRDKKTGFVYDDDCISFVMFDEETREELKEVIKNVIDKRLSELKEEMEIL